MRLTVSVFLLLARKEEARDLSASSVVFALDFFVHFFTLCCVGSTAAVFVITLSSD